mgnify:CR=1 FL=1
MKSIGSTFLIVMVLLQSGCAMNMKSSGVLNTSENNFVITTESENGLPVAQAQAHKEASAKCAGLNKQINVSKMQNGYGTGNLTQTYTYTLHFSCM